MQNWRSNTGAAQTLNLKFLACFPMCVGEVRYQAPQYHSLARFACCCCCRSLFFSPLSSSSFSLQPFSLVFDRGGKSFRESHECVQHWTWNERKREENTHPENLLLLSAEIYSNFLERASGSDVGVATNWTKLEQIWMRILALQVVMSLERSFENGLHKPSDTCMHTNAPSDS